MCAPVPPRAASQDFNNHRIRRIDIATGSTTTLAGTGTYAFRDDVGASAQFYSPTGIAIAPNGGFALVAVRASPAPLPHTAPSPRGSLSPRTRSRPSPHELPIATHATSRAHRLRALR